jgi:hypothetical protein
MNPWVAAWVFSRLPEPALKLLPAEKMRATIAQESRPASLTMAMAPEPGGVEIAAIVSSKFKILPAIYFGPNR